MNIYQIKQEFINIFDELEENGGELTDELAEKLTITKESFKDKVKSYSHVIQMLNRDLEDIKSEKKRLNEFAERKQKIINNLTNIIIKAIEEFGDVKKSGVPYVDYGTGEISIRRANSVEINEETLQNIERGISAKIHEDKNNNQLDVINHLDEESLLNYVHTYDPNITINDINSVKVDVALEIPILDLVNGEGYNAMREAVKYLVYPKISANVSKSELRNSLKENGAIAPNLAKLVINKSLQIK